MKVNFNNLRKQAIYAYDELAESINHAILKKGCDTAYIEGYGHIHEGTIVIPAEDLDKVMSTLRTMIGSIAMVHEENNPDFIDVYAEVFPEEKDERMVEFNPESDND